MESTTRLTRRNIAVLTGLAVVLVLAVTLILILRPQPAPSATAPAPSTSSAAAAPSTAANGCPTLDETTATPNAEPQTSWELVAGAAVPKTAAGPGITTGMTRRCYARTPLGAVSAAANFSTLLGVEGGAETVLNEQTTRGPIRDALLASSANVSRVQGAAVPQLRGFALAEYDGRTAMVQLAWGNRGQLYASTAAVTWDGQDWKLDGDPLRVIPQVRPITTLDGFVPWSGVGS